MEKLILLSETWSKHPSEHFAMTGTGQDARLFSTIFSSSPVRREVSRRASHSISNSDLFSLSQASCHWWLQLSRTRLTLQRLWPKRFLFCAKWYSPLWLKQRMKPLSASHFLLPNCWIFTVSLEASFHLMRFHTCVRPHSVLFLPLYTSLNWRQTRQALIYHYLIFFSLVNVLHNIMRRFSKE